MARGYDNGVLSDNLMVIDLLAVMQGMVSQVSVVKLRNILGGSTSCRTFSSEDEMIVDLTRPA
ncbi:hypothetical protein IFR05_009486 [Cadophora sp. M221]|nr:hypothetical protein IFR05_009486 [Cadophora sp. M221]